MKKTITILLIFVNILAFSQQKIQKEHYKNGQLKYEKTFEKGKLIILKEFYKNGQVKYMKITNPESLIEEAYSKKGELIIRMVNGKVEFSAYEDAINELKNKNNDEEQKHNHHHNHGEGGHHH